VRCRWQSHSHVMDATKLTLNGHTYFAAKLYDAIQVHKHIFWINSHSDSLFIEIHQGQATLILTPNQL